MTLAETLKNDAKNLLDNIPWLQEKVISQIKTYGHFSIICDTHIKNVSTYSLPQKYEYPIQNWAKENGFITYNTYNSFGVKSIKIEL